MAKVTLKPENFAETDAVLADQLQAALDEETNQSDWAEIELTFCKVGLRRIITALRAGTPTKTK